MKYKPILKRKPSAILTFAMKMFELCRADPKYKINMARWHEPQDKGPCEVCLAGSVMAKFCGVSITTDTAGEDAEGFTKKTDRILTAINDFRMGLMWSGIHTLGYDIPNDMAAVESVTYYRESPEDFIADMQKIIAKLEKVGL